MKKLGLGWRFEKHGHQVLRAVGIGLEVLVHVRDGGHLKGRVDEKRIHGSGEIAIMFMRVIPGGRGLIGDDGLLRYMKARKEVRIALKVKKE